MLAVALLGLGSTHLLAQPAPSSPTGLISDTSPSYTWTPVSGATDYQLWVNGAQGNVINGWFAAAAACSASCSVRPAVVLAEGPYVFWVRAKLAAGFSPWSAGMTFRVSSFNAPPAAAQPGSPTGIISDTLPSYSWAAVPTATDYYLWVNGPSGNVFRQWYRADEICSATCSVKPEITLAEGPHAWWLRTANSAGVGPWSAGMPFRVSSSAAPPGAATLVAPKGVIASNNPAYSWNEVPTATDYHLWINKASGNLHRQWYRAADICRGGACSVTPNLTLNEGPHVFWVQTRNGAGPGPWSSGMGFRVSRFGAPPAAAVLISPSGSTSETSPAFNWNKADNATDYFLWINGPSGNVFRRWYKGSDICSATCAVRPEVVLSSGNHVWWVQTANSAGAGPWSSGMPFVVNPNGAPGAAVLVSPSGDITDSMPSYVWNKVADATQYILSVKAVGGQEVVHQLLEGAQVCAAQSATCSTRPAVRLMLGAYAWTIQTKNQAGNGPVSQPLKFKVNQAPPGPATLVSPVGDINDPMPTYVWNVVADATEYILQVTASGSQQPAVSQTYQASMVCQQGQPTCAAKPPVTLEPGTYSWTIQTKNGGGLGPKSQPLVFNLRANAPGQATLVSPSGNISDNQPTYVWNVAANAQEYILLVVGQGNQAPAVSQTFQAAMVCQQGQATCSARPPVTLQPGTYSWTIQTKSGAVLGPVSQPLVFNLKAGTPGGATLVSPTGDINETQPTYVWSNVANATEYILAVSSGNQQVVNQTFQAAMVCQQGQANCSARPPTPLQPGTYSWTIQTRNNSGNGPVSQPLSFNVNAGVPGQATLVSPTGTINDAMPTYVWNVVANATEYVLNVKDAGGADRILQTLQSVMVCQQGQATCSARPAVQLAAATYTWTIQSRNNAGNGPVSGSLTFTVSSAPANITVQSHQDNDPVPGDGFPVFGTVGQGVTQLTGTVNDPALGITINQRSIEIASGGRWTFLVLAEQISQGQTLQVTFTSTDAGQQQSSLTLSLRVVAPDRRVFALLNRITFGATPELLNEAMTLGADGFLAQQLNPSSIDDSAFEAVKAGLPRASLDNLQRYQILHAVLSKRQLLEVMTQFWDNHFSTDVNEEGNLVSYEFAENDAFRSAAFGRFRDLLQTSATSPAMLWYLDNAESVASAPNENYARELMELHTLSVNGGYTQRDVEEVARVFTGWQVQNDRFFFNNADHDQGNKVVLGVNIPSGGMAEGLQVLDLLAAHRSTAMFICRKLAEVFISDQPTSLLVNSCADVFQANQTASNQMALVVEFLLESAEFDQAVNFRAKVKTPLELVAGFIRQLRATPGNGTDMNSYIESMGMDLFENPLPTGWSETGDDWVDTTLLLERAQFTNQVVRNSLTGSSTRVDLVNFFRSRGYDTAEAIVGLLFELFFQKELSELERQIGMEILTLGGTSRFDINATDARARLQKLIWTLGSFPGYQFQ
jgi:uncharacterized protein (DUF1800 family)